MADLVGFSRPDSAFLRFFFYILWIVETVSFIFMSIENHQRSNVWERKKNDHLYAATHKHTYVYVFLLLNRSLDRSFFYIHILFGYLQSRYTNMKIVISCVSACGCGCVGTYCRRQTFEMKRWQKEEKKKKKVNMKKQEREWGSSTYVWRVCICVSM